MSRFKLGRNSIDKRLSEHFGVISEVVDQQAATAQQVGKARSAVDAGQRRSAGPRRAADAAAPHQHVAAPLRGDLAALAGAFAAPAGAVVTVVPVKGSPEALLAAYDDYEAEHAAAPAGRLLHLCARSSEGITLVEVWESEAALRSWVSRSADAVPPRMLAVHRMAVGRALV